MNSYQIDSIDFKQHPIQLTVGHNDHIRAHGRISAMLYCQYLVYRDGAREALIGSQPKGLLELVFSFWRLNQQLHHNQALPCAEIDRKTDDE